jgi:dUTP pyrophosphatase
MRNKEWLMYLVKSINLALPDPTGWVSGRASNTEAPCWDVFRYRGTSHRETIIAYSDCGVWIGGELCEDLDALCDEAFAILAAVRCVTMRPENYSNRASLTESPVDVLLTRFDSDVPVPQYAYPGDAGADLVSTHDVTLQPGERTTVGTGIAIALPPGFAGFVHPRSGLASRVGLGIVNAPGTIDSQYRGEIRVCLINHDPTKAIKIYRLDRIAQLIIQKVSQATFREVDALPESDRGGNGYGSTG